MPYCVLIRPASLLTIGSNDTINSPKALSFESASIFSATAGLVALISIALFANGVSAAFIPLYTSNKSLAFSKSVPKSFALKSFASALDSTGTSYSEDKPNCSSLFKSAAVKVFLFSFILKLAQNLTKSFLDAIDGSNPTFSLLKLFVQLAILWKNVVSPSETTLKLL